MPFYCLSDEKGDRHLFMEEVYLRLLLQSLTKTEENIRQLATRLGVDTDLLLAGKVPHPEEQDLDLLDLEGELEIFRHLREQLESLEHLTIVLVI
jgi:hypothetical protein